MTRALRDGEVIGDRYRIERHIGRGGVGAVYAARDLTLGRAVALKVLRAQVYDDDELRFEREARIMGQLRHPGCVAIHDFGEHQGLLYLVMELLDGKSLRDVLDDHPGPLPLWRLLELAVPLADALAAAHALPVVHRDLKPENIIVVAGATGRARPVIVDFGLAFMPRGGALGRVTVDGLVSGTPAYVSPEQARGSEIGPPSDVYSLGCVIFEMAAGGAPFHGLSVELVTQHLFVRPPSLRVLRPELPEALAELLADMLLKSPGDRPQAEDVHALLADLEAGRVARARPLPRTRASRQIEAVTERMAARAEGGTVVVIGTPLPAELVAACAGAGIEIAEAGEVRLAAEATPDEVRALAAAGPVVAGARRGDLGRATELLRAGAAEVVELPLVADELTHKLRRVMITARRRRGS